MNDNDPKVQSYAAAYIKDYAGKDFSNDPKGYAEWFAANRDKDPNELLKKNENNATTGNGAADPATALSLEGELLWQQGKMAEATKRFQQAVQLDPKSTTALNGLGWSLFNSGHADDAVEAFEKCMAVDPNHPAALNGLGQIYLNRGDYKKAEGYLLKGAPEAPAAQFGLGRLYLVTGKYEEAQKWLEKASEGAPADPILKQMLEAAKKRELPKGLKVRLQPMASNQNSKTAELTAQAWTEFFGRDYTAAEANFRKVLETKPDDPSAMNGLGFCLLNMGNAKEAKPYFEKLLANEPDALGPLNGLARCLKEEGKIDEAIKTWERGYKIDSSPNDIAGGLAMAYLEKKQFAKAVPILEQLVKASPSNEHYQKLLETARMGELAGKGATNSDKAESEK
jgi:Flp pilus assembly protein TadD